MKRTRIETILTAIFLLTATMVSQGQTKPENAPASQPAMRPYCIFDTSQAKCYSTQAEIPSPKPGQPFYGQDAQFLGKQPSLTLSKDEKTVSDNNTGLTWMRSPNLTNTPPIRTDKMTFAAAQAWGRTVNATRYGGFADWRLPNVKELQSLVDYANAPDLCGRPRTATDPALRLDIARRKRYRECFHIGN